MTDVFDGCLFIGSTGLFNEQFLSEKEDLSKRSMYGQATFDLLRQRVLHRPEKSARANETTKEMGHKRRAGRTKKPGGEEKILTSQRTTFGISEVA